MNDLGNLEPGVFVLKAPRVELDIRFEGDRDWINLYNPDTDETFQIDIQTKMAAEITKAIGHWWTTEKIDPA